MPALTLSPVTVTFSAAGASCNPGTVIVSRALNNGVQWTASQTGYTFDGININEGSDSDFGTPTFSTNSAGKSVMRVTDSVSDLGDYSYGLSYTDPEGKAGTFDPTIRNTN